MRNYSLYKLSWISTTLFNKSNLRSRGRIDTKPIDYFSKRLNDLYDAGITCPINFILSPREFFNNNVVINSNYTKPVNNLPFGYIGTVKFPIMDKSVRMYFFSTNSENETFIDTQFYIHYNTSFTISVPTPGTGSERLNRFFGSIEAAERYIVTT